MSKVHVFTARMPVHEYEALRAYAHFTRQSINDLVLAAVRAYLGEQGRAEHLERMVEEVKAKLRATLDGLGD